MNAPIRVDTIPPDDGPECRDCPHGYYRHRPREKLSAPPRRDCLYCPCKQYVEKGFGL